MTTARELRGSASSPTYSSAMRNSGSDDTPSASYFAEKLRCETDAADVHAAQEAGDDFVLVDSRGESSWSQGHIVGAVHMPTAQIVERALDEISIEIAIVVYCWGPGCNGATRAALEFAKLGYQVKEMIGGYEYWVREGYPVQDEHGVGTRAKDPLTVPLNAITCEC